MKDEESMVGSAVNEQVESTTEKTVEEVPKTEKTYTRGEVNKMLNSEREKLKSELLREYESKKSEAEKLAKMDTEQKLGYENDQLKKELETLKNEIKSKDLKDQAISIATEKGLPLGYIEDFNYSTETAESVKDKIDKLVKLRSTDLDGYLKDKLKQEPPKAVNENKGVTDPYLKGFMNYGKYKK